MTCQILHGLDEFLLAVGKLFFKGGELGVQDIDVPIESCDIFLNVIDDKRQLLESVGIRLDGDIPWPSDFIPQAVRCDNGSDFTSRQFEEVCGRLDIRIENVPPRMGSLKPLVEHSFHLFQDKFRSDMNGIGLIEKDAVTKRKILCLTLKEFRQMLYSFVMFHNARANSNYKRTPDMIEKRIGTSPIELWEYGVANSGAPRQISTPAQKIQYVYDLMVEDKASISREGIMYKGLYYTTDDAELLEQCYDADKKRIPFEIRYDPRSVEELYCVKDGQLLALPLNINKNNNAIYMGMTWTMYDIYRKAELALKADEQEKKLELDIAEGKVMKDIAAIAKRNRGGNKIKTNEKREARAIEKQYDNNRKKFAARPELEGIVPQQEYPEAEEPKDDDLLGFTPHDDIGDIFD